MDDALNGHQVSEGARGLKLWFSVWNTLPHLASFANTVQYRQYEPWHQSLGCYALHRTPATTWAIVYQSLSPASQPVFKPPSSLSSPHLLSENTVGVDVKSLLEVKLYCTVFSSCAGVIFPW